VQRFVIFGIGRSGSSLMTDLLNSSPHVTCDFTIDLAGNCLIDAMRSRSRAVELLGAKGYGLRLLVPHLLDDYAVRDIPAFLAQLYAEGWKIIHVRRSSRERTIVSFLHAVHQGFHLRENDGAWQFEPIVLDAEELLDWRDTVDGWSDIAASALRRVDAYEVLYERDLATEDVQLATMARIVRWLVDLPPGTLRTQFRRQIPERPLQELIANYPEVKDLLNQPAETRIHR